jgi:hypothetical protein
MAANAKINPNGGPCSWSISVSHLKVGVYRAILFDNKGTILKTWKDQRTDDSLPDTFPMRIKPKRLQGTTLWWQCIVSDPSDQGGLYTCTVSIQQDGNTLCQDQINGQVPAGNGKVDFVGDQISLI